MPLAALLLRLLLLLLLLLLPPILAVVLVLLAVVAVVARAAAVVWAGPGAGGGVDLGGAARTVEPPDLVAGLVRVLLLLVAVAPAGPAAAEDGAVVEAGAGAGAAAFFLSAGILVVRVECSSLALVASRAAPSFFPTHAQTNKQIALFCGSRSKRYYVVRAGRAVLRSVVLAARAQHNTTTHRSECRGMCCCTTGGNERPHTEAAARRRRRRRTGSEGGDTDTSQAIRNTQINEQGRLLFACCLAEKMPKSQRWFFWRSLGAFVCVAIADGGRGGWNHGKYLLPDRYRTIAHYK